MRKILNKLAALLILVFAADPASAQDVSLGVRTNDSLPPLICPVDHFVGGMRCTGGYCQSVEITCRQIAGATWVGRPAFQRFISEEGAGRRDCPSGSAMAGVACDGTNCDNLSILCAPVGGRRVASCTETAWFSEEGGGRQTLEAGQVAAALICSGRYCDNKRLLACRLQ